MVWVFSGAIPTQLAVGFVDGLVIDAGVALCHVAGFIKFGAIPCVFCGSHLLEGGFFSEWREWWAWSHGEGGLTGGDADRAGRVCGSLRTAG